MLRALAAAIPPRVPLAVLDPSGLLAVPDDPEPDRDLAARLAADLPGRPPQEPPETLATILDAGLDAWLARSVPGAHRRRSRLYQPARDSV